MPIEISKKTVKKDFIEKLKKLSGQNISKCFQCGTCTALCPTGALEVIRPEMEVAFDASKCSACELCCVVCPARAMEVKINHQAL